LTFGAVDEPLEDQRTIPDASESAGRNREIVAHEVELGDLCLFGKIGFIGMGNPDFASFNEQNFGCVVLAHGIPLTVAQSANPQEL
jgi:hypothetical protein